MKKIQLPRVAALLLFVIGSACSDRTPPEGENTDHPADAAGQEGVMRDAAFRMTTMDYFGGDQKEWEYSDGSAIYREHSSIEDRTVESPKITLTEYQRTLLSEIMQLVVKQELWNQPDAEDNDVLDGGDVCYEFDVGTQSGKFKLINIHPFDLEDFEHKCTKMMNSLQAATKEEIKTGWSAAEEKPTE